MKYIYLFVLSIVFCTAFGLSNEDISFLTDKEQFQILAKHADSIMLKAFSGDEQDIKCVLNYAQRSDQPGLAILCHKRLATEQGSLEDALQWLLLMQTSEVDSVEFAAEVATVGKALRTPLDRQVFINYASGLTEAELLTAIAKAPEYNTVIEAMAKAAIDEISVERSDSLALGMIDSFEISYPKSKYAQIAFYYKLYHLTNARDWDGMYKALPKLDSVKPVEAYIAALYLVSPTYRKNSTNGVSALELARKYLAAAESDKAQILLYDIYQPQDWQYRIDLQAAKVVYYQMLSSNGLYGDEEKLIALKKAPKAKLKKLVQQMEAIQFSNNDRGEIAEQYYWLGRVCLLQNTKTMKLKAAKYLCQCLVWGAPRKKYDDEAWKFVLGIHKELRIKEAPKVWQRKLMNYSGIVFGDASAASGLEGLGYTRVALGDYDADGLSDILFSGNYLYHNNGNMCFSDSSEAANLSKLNSSGGLFADFNRDGLLDLVSYSHAEDGMGEVLMKNMNGKRFVSVNERAGDIDDRFPSEAAAWIDTDGKGFPSLYIANYEQWQQRSGFPDFFWKNDSGYFSDKSVNGGFRLPAYTDNPGQAGRGVAPADFDNDGKQEIFVTNYRLNRNFCWKQVDTMFVDIAALYGLAGTNKQGYYGHSIGADWGDYDNDGDLDLFVANLAHPRFLDISDKSMLLRNDGLACRVVEGDSIYYWQFTDVTALAGITYDELHSDPLFFDADNDGYLDLFITSVYENDRSYLYHNNGDGTFTDVTWLAGVRVYNGWGCATGDLDRDGKTDLVVGSGNGAKILKNLTITSNQAIYLKPVWKGDTIYIEDNPRNFTNLPQSPAFGTRVIVKLKSPQGNDYQLIRELSSAKGTASQNAAELHFGIGKSKVLEIKRFTP
ncbi:MAG: CRTAC1 family protein [Candidatus Cloacimonas sp.]|jgi:hypothetical protein|nr:CRTAC1 family protein [Candidatus Cloacimonas sp.]